MALKFTDSVMEPISSKTSKDDSHMKVINIALDSLKPFPEHPFKLYEGQKLNDLIQSIQTNGVLTPILVRSIDNGNYEILAGHNRVHAAKEAGLEKIPATVCVPESEDEARILVIESNFNQRSTKDMKPSELASSLHMLNEAMKKKPGYRTDLEESESGSQPDNRLRTMHVIGNKYGFSQAKISRYIRVAKLPEGLLECLDDGLIKLGVAEYLSYLRPNEQNIVQNLIQKKIKISGQQAKELKVRSQDHELSEDEIKQIINPDAPVIRKRSVKLSEDLFSKYFTEGQDQDEIEDTIKKALELLQSQNPNNDQ